MAKLVLELSDNHIQVLERAAQERGISIDQIVAELIDTISTPKQVPPSYDVTQDSLYTIRAHDSIAPSDLASNADAYL